jgi:uncharacterized alpha-E superfamily protein
MSAHTLSSTAERCYWFGRYLERVEATARMVTVHANLLMDLPRRLPQAWQPLVEITGNLNLYEELFGEVGERNVCRYLINDTRHPGSLVNSLNWARENARTLRGIIPKPALEYVNEAYLFAREHLTEPLSRARRSQGLESVAECIQRIDGFMSANMMHDAHWRFLRMGHFLERADMTTRVIDVGAGDFWRTTGFEVFADIQWRSVLRSLYAHHSYNTSVAEPISQAPVIDFLLNHPGLPRSVAYSVTSLRNNLRGLPRHERPLRAVNRLHRELSQTHVQGLDSPALSEFLDQCQIRLSEIHLDIHKAYFGYRPQWRQPRRKPTRN